jgi:hypothetical protein
MEIWGKTMIPMWIKSAMVIAVGATPFLAWATYQMWVQDGWRGVVEFWGLLLGLITWVGVVVWVGWALFGETSA